MAGPFFIDDAGDGTDGLTWAKAELSFQALDAAIALASDEYVYVGHDSVGTDAGAALVLTLPASGKPLNVISSTHVSGVAVAYQRSATDQILATGAASDITLDGSGHFVGVQMKAGRDIIMGNDANESLRLVECNLFVGQGRNVSNGATGSSGADLLSCVVNLSADVSNQSAVPLSIAASGSTLNISGLTFVNAGFRTGPIITGGANGRTNYISGADFSGFTQATAIMNGASGGSFIFTNCKRPSGLARIDSGTRVPNFVATFVNVGAVDSPWSIEKYDYFGDCIASNAVYRTGGAAPEGEASAWLIATQANCSEGAPFATPWMPALVSTAGSRTFDVYITNDNADLFDDEAWISLEYLGTADSPLVSRATDQRVITTTRALQTDDTVSTWTGSPTFTYKQKLSVTATVAEPGMYRARVMFGVTSMATSRNCYVDPLVVVS